ncbi:MAG TPA: GNAT family N-acetyltransferase [Terracidiphilus sp.]|nr:GNAT family N-acetyltransferase [Terracidiphilus sp.]
MEFTIRSAALEDAHAVARVQVESWRTTYPGIVPLAFLASLSVEASAQRWREQLSSGNNPIFVAEDMGHPFGFASGGPLRSPIPGYDGELYAIYLLRDSQRHGAGRRLVETIAGALRTRGFHGMAGWVLARNPAVGFYKALGGVQIARQPIAIGGAELEELAFGWPDLDLCLGAGPRLSREAPA